MLFFSVIIPLYNKENFIEDTLQSVLNQSYKNYEIIIINDGSTDNSLKVAEKTLKNIENKTIVTQENKGLSAARNKAISLAKGNIIALLDADDLWSTIFLEEIINLHNTYPKAKFYGSHYYEVSNSNNKIPSSAITKKGPQLVTDFFKVGLQQPIICQSSFAFKREIKEEFKYDETINFSEDIDFYLQCFQENSLAYINTPLARIRVGGVNQMTTNGIKNKTIVNLDKYEVSAKSNKSLKQYIDFYRYSFGSQYKQLGLISAYKLITNPIELSNLTFKQRILLKSPTLLFLLIIKLKKALLKMNIKLDSY